MNPLHLTEKSNHYWEVNPARDSLVTCIMNHLRTMCIDISCMWLLQRVLGVGSWKVNITRPGDVHHLCQSKNQSTHSGNSSLPCVVKSPGPELRSLGPPAYSGLRLLCGARLLPFLSLFNKSLVLLGPFCMLLNSSLRQEEPRHPMASWWSTAHPWRWSMFHHQEIWHPRSEVSQITCTKEEQRKQSEHLMVHSLWRCWAS